MTHGFMVIPFLTGITNDTNLQKMEEQKTLRATFVMDQSYFKEDLNEWIRHISKGRKYEPYFCAAFMLGGSIVILAIPRFQIVGIFLLVIGIFESYRYLAFKRMWLNERIQSKLFNKQLIFEISNGLVTQITSVETEELERKLIKFVPSKKGIFAYPKKGYHIYIPHSSFSPALSIDQIMRKITMRD